ncbi:MAG: DUF3488 and transglutaminase-like domain-containing protein [Nocardioidaceae bacterium]
MSAALNERHRMALLGWVATVLTGFAFLPALTQKSFIFTAAFVGGLVVLVGVGLRAARAPALVILPVQLIALAEILLIANGEKLKYGLFPTGQTIDRLDASIRSAMDIAQKYAAPAPPSPGLTLLVVFYVGLIAVLVDFIAVTLHRVPLAGLPLLALYSVPVAALPNGVPFLAFLPGAAGFIAMLMIDERDRLAHWGRLVARNMSVDQEATIDTRGLSATGRRISSLALASAVVIPLFIPVFSPTLLNGNGRGGNGNGEQLSFSDPMVSLANSLRRPSPVDLLRVTGDVRPQYLRLSVLDVPGPNAWTVSPIDLSRTQPANSILPGPSGLEGFVSTTSHSMRIDPLADFPSDSSWLPVPFDIRSVGVNGDWSYIDSDQTVTANTNLAAVSLREYPVSYAVVRPTQEQLINSGRPPADVLRDYGKVPTGVPPVVGDLARAVTNGATSHYQQAQMLQSWFRDSNEFTYDLQTGYGYGYQAMQKFLEKRRGFCQHFSATMAMMSRELGIPSRVVVGFLKPERLDSDGWVFTSDNVHSWTELYFAGVGWTLFDPTPNVGAPYPPWAPLFDPNKIPESPTVNTASESTAPTQKPRDTARTTTDAVASGTSGPSSGGSIPSRWWLVGVLVLGLAMLPAVSRLAIRRRRMSRPVEAGEAAESAWVELRDHILDLRLPWTGSMTPRARRRSVEPMLEGDPEGLAALARLALIVERSRFATSLPTGSAPASDAREVMAVISRRAEPRQRLRAWLWPASLLPDLRAGWRRLRDRVPRVRSIDE